jgi:hypothetical protein
MKTRSSPDEKAAVVLATGETPPFRLGDPMRILSRSPAGHHYRAPKEELQREIAFLIQSLGELGAKAFYSSSPVPR